MKRAATIFTTMILGASAPAAFAQSSSDMSFFITSAGPGNGAKLGGLAGADAHCQLLAEGAGASGKTWRAYLSNGNPEVHARDRIGDGPWHNAKGVLIARDLDELHGPANKISKENGLDEKGAMINGRGDRPNMHDIMTGSDAEGRLVPGMTCNDWTSDGDGRTFVGHHDRMGLRDDAPSRSWNAAHPSRGCAQDALRRSGGNGLFYCFAVR